MEDLLILFYVLFAIAVIVVLITVIGHGIWITLRWLVRQFLNSAQPIESQVRALGASPRCSNCNFIFVKKTDFCGRCGAPRPTGMVSELLKDLAATGRQLERFQRSGVVDENTYERLKQQLEAEQLRLTQYGTTA